MLSLWRNRSKAQQTSASRHVQLVGTVSGLGQQLKDCKFRTTDIFVEYSTSRLGLLDFPNLLGHLRKCGYKPEDLIGDVSCFSLLPAFKNFARRTCGLEYWRQAYLFRILFPKDPLVDKNHSAAIDVIQLAKMARLVAELTK
jgi:hypothetical protein